MGWGVIQQAHSYASMLSEQKPQAILHAACSAQRHAHVHNIVPREERGIIIACTPRCVLQTLLKQRQCQAHAEGLYAKLGKNT